MFPGATSTIYRNDAGEVLGWDSGASDDSPDPAADDDYAADRFDQVCQDHKCFALQCPRGCSGDNLVCEDELCCGPSGCCSRCCGTDEDDFRGAWHTGCTVQA